ncbi:MAG: ABC transporter ATP-binding protein, partial [Cyclobacteriaceae bacterium]|nr:ABC transporter ATP-binding protein [Cyclobacteriaceae bacterium]
MTLEKEEVKSGQILDLKVLKRLLTFVKPYKVRFYFLIFLTVLLGATAPIRPILIQFTLDHHVAFNDVEGLINMTILLVALLVVQSIIQYAHTYISGWMGQYIIRDIRVQLYKHLLRLRLKFYDKTPIGRLVTRTISDIETLADVFSQGLAAMISDVLQLLFILIVMFYYDWRLALVSLSTFPIMLLSTYIFKEKIKVSFNEVRNAVSNLNSYVQEHITGMKLVQIFGSEQVELDKFKTINKEHRRANLKSVMYYSIYFPVAEVISAAGIGLLVWYGAKGVINFEETGITMGLLIMFIMFINMFFRPIRMIADRFNTLQMGIVSTQRIINLLDNEEHIPDEGNFQPESVKGNVTFEKVWFAYNGDEYVL